MLTMDSLAITICNEGSFAQQIPQLRVEKLPDSEFNKLNSVMAMPSYCLIERAEHYRRYSLETKQMIIDITKSLLI